MPRALAVRRRVKQEPEDSKLLRALVLAITLNLLANYYHNKRMGPPPITIMNTQGVPAGNPTPTTSPTSPQP